MIKELYIIIIGLFFFQAEDGIRDLTVTGVQTCALPLLSHRKIQTESRTFIYSGGFRPNATVMRFYNILGEREAETGGINIDFKRILVSTALGKEFRFEFIRYTHASIFNCQNNLL